MAPPRRHGRIHPHERDTDDDAPILGEGALDLDTNEEFCSRYHESIRATMDDKARKDYRCRIQRIVKFWEAECVDYCKIGTRCISQTELQDVTKFHFNRYKHDLVYKGLNVKYVLHFLMATKLKPNGKIKGHQDVRKYKDAIMWGANVAGERLPVSFFVEMDQYLASYKKIFIKAKKQGEVDEKEADPIPVSLYQMILKWSIEENNIFCWFWSLAQWTCMGRCASIDPLAFHNFKIAQDSIVCKYDDSKADKSGDHLSEKNIYANPFEWTQCFWTGMGVYCALECQRLAEHERLFLSPGVSEGAAALRYCEQLHSIVSTHETEVLNQMRPEHFNPYGLRKGSATHAVSGTTVTPSLPSVSRRGEWSQGGVLDVYWHFASIGDHYLGRILACLPSNDKRFATLPPHWKIANPLSNEHVSRAMNMLYGQIIMKYHGKDNDPTPMLLRCLACLVHHADSLLNVMLTMPQHDMAKLTLLHDIDLIALLKPLVTLDPTPMVMSTPTGVPPHIELSSMMAQVLDMMTDLMASFRLQTGEVIHCVQKAIEEKAWDSGHVTGSRLKELLEEYNGNQLKKIDERLIDVQQHLMDVIGNRGITAEGASIFVQGADNHREGNNDVVRTTFMHGGRFYGVPKDFEFPRNITLQPALRFWLCGMSVSTDGLQRVRPFIKLSLRDLPERIKSSFKLNWKGIFDFLHDDAIAMVDFQALALPDTQNQEVHAAYTRCIDSLQKRVSYCFNNTKGRDPSIHWSIATWSLRTRYSSIKKHGTENDKAQLLQGTKRNQSRLFKARKRPLCVRPKYLARQIRNDHERRETARHSQSQEETAHSTSHEEETPHSGSQEETTHSGSQQERAHSQSQETQILRNERHETTDERGRIYGHCCIDGCVFPQFQLNHHCKVCENPVHNLCAQRSMLVLEENELTMYCSTHCKNQDNSY